MLQETKESILSTITLFNGEFFKFGKVLYFTHFLSAFMFLVRIIRIKMPERKIISFDQRISFYTF